MKNFHSDETIEIENEIVEKVGRYKYLGQTVMFDEHTGDEIMTRIKAGWSCFWKT